MITIQNNLYTNNVASSGQIYFADNLIASLNNLNFTNNSASIGGVFYLNQLQRSGLELILQINNSVLVNNSASIQGGVFMSSHSKLNLTIFNSTFKTAYAVIGGILSISDI